MSEVVFITVNYRKTKDTFQFVKSLSLLKDFERCVVLIVDNDSTDHSRKRLGELEEIFGNVCVFPQESNLYYWRGAQFAVNELSVYAKKRFKWVVVCNNDIVIEQPNFILELLSLNSKEHGVIAPRIISRVTGLDQNPFKRRPLSRLEHMRLRLLFSSFYMYYLLVSVRRLYRLILPRVSTHSLAEGQIYAPHGSFVIFSQRFFEAGGYLETGFEMYAEELTTAEIVKGLGLGVTYFPSLYVIHNEHSTTGCGYTREKFRMHKDAYDLFVGKYLKS